MALRTLNRIDLCSGVGMLGLAVELGCEFFGVRSRSVAHIERDAYAAATLVARMEDAALERAPVWDDLESFDGRAWSGRVDCLTAGFPCQPWSSAGKQQGIDDARWLWPIIARIIRDAEPELVFLENVHGLVSGGGLHFVLDDLAEGGFDAEWLHLRASDVGASHRRERVFVLAYRGLQHFDLQQRAHGAEYSRGSTGMGNTSGARESDNAARSGSRHSVGEPGGLVGNASEPAGERDTGTIPQSQTQGSGQRQHDGDLPERFEFADDGLVHTTSVGADADEQRRQLRSTEQASIFAPGPAADWRDIPEHYWPAIEPGLCVLAAGMALVVDESRADQLRCGGNGVVAIQGAAAFIELVRRAMK